MQKFSIREFSDRIAYFINAIAESNATRPVACMTLLPYYRDLGIEPTSKQLPKPDEYREALRHAADVCPHPNVHLIHGPDLLMDLAGLSTDLIHPGDFGMAAIAHALAPRLKSHMVPAAPMKTAR